MSTDRKDYVILPINIKKMKLMFSIIFALLMVSCEVEPITPTGGGGPTGYSNTIKMRTDFSEDWDNWEFEIGDTTVEVETSFSEDWDNWEFSYGSIDGDIETNFSEDWDNWTLQSDDYTVKIRTSFSEDWDNWDIDDYANGWHADVTTGFSEDWDDWDISFSGGGGLDVRTAFSEDWDSWEAFGDFPSGYPLEYRIALLFVPVITNVMIQNGLIVP
ncbi:MAG: hypothetical protein ACI8ZM_003227 [Crocinitomix sp.]|jgi:hypothetical protein